MIIHFTGIRNKKLPLGSQYEYWFLIIVLLPEMRPAMNNVDIFRKLGRPFGQVFKRRAKPYDLRHGSGKRVQYFAVVIYVPVDQKVFAYPGLILTLVNKTHIVQPQARFTRDVKKRQQ